MKGVSNRAKGVVSTKGRWKGGGCGSRETGGEGGHVNSDTSTALLDCRINCRYCFDDSDECSLRFY